jgi:CRP/FNR family transcriptional regulator, cyclic AMP receptor protein
MDVRVIEERVDIPQVMRLPGARASTLLGALDPEGLDTLLHTAALTRFGTRDTISPRHAPDDALHLLVRGAAVQHSWPSEGAREYFARPLGEGEVMGITDVLALEPLRRETRSLGPSVTIRIPGPAVRGLLEGSHAVAAALARVTVLALQRAERDQLVLATGDAMARVTYRLVELAERWGIPGEHGIDVDLPLTQAQLGAWAGVSRETTVKSLQWLRQRGMIATSRRHVVVRDLEGLEELARQRGIPSDGSSDGAPPAWVRRDRRRGR